MQIYLSWENLNSAAVTLEIYRGDEPLDRANLPAEPIATLTNGETNYTDGVNVGLGKTYYYVFVTSNSGDRTVSQNYQVTAVSRRGAGPQTLLQGDSTIGYFGTITCGEFIYPSALAATVNVTTTTFPQLTMSRPNPLWYKYVRNNKILFIPEGPIAGGVSWNLLYQNGLVYGMDNGGETATAFPQTTLVPQNAKVKIGSDWYRVRLMKTWFDDDTTTPPVVGNKVAFPEFDDLVAPIYHQVIPTQRLRNIYVNGRYYYADMSLNGVMTSQKLTQELTTATTVAYRGPTNFSSSALEYNTKLVGSQSMSTQSTTAVTSAGGEWWPVLELIEV